MKTVSEALLPKYKRYLEEKFNQNTARYMAQSGIIGAGVGAAAGGIKYLSDKLSYKDKIDNLEYKIKNEKNESKKEEYKKELAALKEKMSNRSALKSIGKGAAGGASVLSGSEALYAALKK